MFSRMRNRLCAIGFLVLLSGCGSEPSLDYTPVEGVVTINGKPEKGVMVRFSPDPEKGNALPGVATGKTDDQGKYALRYEYRGKEGIGAPVGWHRVTLIDTKVGFTPQGQQPKPSAVPQIYSNTATTPLVVEVKASSEPQSIPLEVKK